MKKLLLALLILAVMAAPAFASIQSMKVTGSLSSKFVSQNDMDLGADSGQTDWNSDFFLTITRLRFDADLTDNVAATVELINEREWDNYDSSSADESAVDINQAFVVLREMLYSPLTVIIGRQRFSYSNGLLMSSAITQDTGLATNSYSSDFTKQKAFDAIRAILDYDPLKVEVFYAKLDQNHGSQTQRYDERDMFGVDAMYDFGDDMNTQLEGYFFVQYDDINDNQADGENKDTLYVPGFRVSTNPLEGVSLAVEYAHMYGNDYVGGNLSQERNANAAQIDTSYQIPVLEDYEPVLQYVFTFVSGDLNTETATQAWETQNKGWEGELMFEGLGGNQIWDNLFAVENLLIHDVSLTLTPLEDVTTTLSWIGLLLELKNLNFHIFLHPRSAYLKQKIFLEQTNF